MIELLAPAGDRQTFISAIKNGANAIYVGVKNFNARAKIQSFDFDELASLIKYAHLFDVKVYLTLNIVINDNEINDVLEIIYKANSIGIDAFIVQDLGLCSLLKKIYPGIVLHASTQMAIHNYQGAIIAQKMGLSRIVLSRETSIADIKKIKENTNLEIEYFVQGALCVSFSGNCYMSGLLFGESGNRGKCLQLCRLPYTLKINNKALDKKYYLSAKDLCLADKISELIDAGVTSLKIEGRARRCGYTARAVNVYRRLIDGEQFDKSKLDTLKLGFNRGDYCSGYFDGNGNILETNIQNNTGIKVGKVENFQKGNKFNILIISSDREIGKGDVLKFMHNGAEVSSLSAIDVKPYQDKYAITTTAELNVGDDVHLLVDFDEEKKYIETDKRIPLSVEFIAYAGEHAKLSYVGPNNIRVEVISPEAVEYARTSPLLSQDISTQICKMGNDIFEVKDTDIVIDKIFMAKSQLNEMRRKALSLLVVKMLENYEQRNNIKKIVPYSFENEVIFKRKVVEEKRRIMIQIEDFSIINDELIEICEKIIIKPPEWTEKYFKQLNNFIAKNRLKDKVAIYIPNILTNEDFEKLEKLLLLLPSVSLYINNISGLYFSFKGYEIIAGLMMNIFNRHTVRFLELYNISNIVFSPELNLIDANEISDKSFQNCYCLCYGYMPYMSLEHCPYKSHLGETCSNCNNNQKLSLINSSNICFDYECSKIVNCHFSLINEKPIDNIKELSQFKILQPFLVFKNENINEILHIIRKNI